MSTRAVRLLSKIEQTDESQPRDDWWKDVRQEVQSHARALACNAVVGYYEYTSIHDSICLLCATGMYV